jgi:hypothetical protein
MDIEEWQKRLTENFDISKNGKLFSIYIYENECGRFITEKFHGYISLIDSFLTFFIETIELAYYWVKKKGWPKTSKNYAPILFYFITIFKNFRACENLLMSGYPLIGYALLRNLKDTAIFLAAIAKNLTTLSKLFGVSGIKRFSEKDEKTIVGTQKKEEQRIFNKMKSGLPEDILKLLNTWENLFHKEVHGFKLNYLIEIQEWRKSGVLPTIFPSPNEKASALYMNRSCEIAWLLTRLLPYLQVEENAFGNEWHEKYKILDDSFLFMEKSLSDIGKPVADAFIFFVNDKFSFKDPFYYREADGNG